MKYFVSNDERKGTCYHEFYKGKWNLEVNGFYCVDSIYLHDDILVGHSNFSYCLQKHLDNYSDTGVTEIILEQWEKIKIYMMAYKNELELVNELDNWLLGVYSEYDVVTILGI